VQCSGGRAELLQCAGQCSGTQPNYSSAPEQCSGPYRITLVQRVQCLATKPNYLSAAPGTERASRPNYLSATVQCFLQKPKYLSGRGAVIGNRTELLQCAQCSQWQARRITQVRPVQFLTKAKEPRAQQVVVEK
jgi:hypothetical protein